MVFFLLILLFSGHRVIGGRTVDFSFPIKILRLMFEEKISELEREDKTYKVYLPPKVLEAFHGDI